MFSTFGFGPNERDRSAAATAVTPADGGYRGEILLFFRDCITAPDSRYSRTSKMLNLFVRRHYTTSVDKLNYHQNNVPGKTACVIAVVCTRGLTNAFDNISLGVQHNYFVRVSYTLTRNTYFILSKDQFLSNQCVPNRKY